MRDSKSTSGRRVIIEAIRTNKSRVLEECISGIVHFLAG